MPPVLQIIGALVLTYWCSRAALRLLLNWGTPSQRTFAAHVISLMFLSVVVTWFERSPSAFLSYLPAQIFWFIVDMARAQPDFMKRRSGKRRRSSQAGPNWVGRVIGVGVAVVTAAYLAIGMALFVDQALGYNGVYLIDPGRGFKKANRTDVVYALGRPDLTRAGGQGTWVAGGSGDNPDWLYKGMVISVRFDPQTGFVTSLSCRESHALAREGCPANLGVRVGNHESDLYETLGVPTREYLLPDGKKVMRYHDIGHEYVLERFFVKSVHLYPENSGVLAMLSRFLIWMLP